MLLRLLVLTPALFLLACDPPDAEPETPKVTVDDLARETREAADALAGYARDQQQRFAAEADERLADLEVEIERLREQAEDASADTRARLDDELAAIEARWAASKERLRDLQEKSGPAWDEVRQGLERAMDDLASAADRARDRLREDN